MKTFSLRGCASAGALLAGIVFASSASADTAAANCTPAAVVQPAANQPALVGTLADWIKQVQVQAKCQDSFKFDYGVPTSPGLALIGTSTAISSPSADMKPYTFSLPASFGGSKDSQAFTGDASVVWVMRQLGSAPQSEPYDDFLKLGYWDQLAYRTRLQAALFKGDDGGGDATKAKASRLAVGLSASLLPSSDPVTVKDDTVKDANGNPVSAWDSCVDAVLGSELVSKQFNAVAAVAPAIARNELAHVGVAVRFAAVPGATPAQMSDADDAIDKCLAADGPCKSLTGADTLASDRATHNYSDARKIIDAMVKQADVPVIAFSAKNAQAIGLDKAFDACLSKANALARASAQLDIGVGAVWSGTPGKVENFTDANAAIWISGRLPIGVFDSDITSAKNYGNDSSSLMLGGAIRATLGQQIATGNAATPFFKADMFDGWVGIERYSASMRFGAQIGYMKAESETAALKPFNKSGIRWLASASLRADKLFGGLLNGYVFTEDTQKQMENGIWVNVTYGSSSGTTATLDDKTVMVSLSFSPTEAFDFFGEVTPPQ
jgi:hypothetical protein